MKIAFITGINGQDGSYLSELLLEKGYYVFGIIRRMSHINTTRIDHLFEHPKFKLFYGDLTDGQGMSNVLAKVVAGFSLHDIEVIEVYNLGAQSHVQVSFELPDYTLQTDLLGTLHLLEAIRHSTVPITKFRFYQAGTSEMYGVQPPNITMNEETVFNPVSPYAIAKIGSHYLVKMYRQGYSLFACNGILFNHESPRRGETFVTKKIVDAVKKIKAGKQEVLTLGNLDSVRDWGHAKDYVKGMWLMLQTETPDDYVLGTGHTCTVREFVVKCFSRAGITIRWEGNVGIDALTGIVRVNVHSRYFRPVEVGYLKADYSKAKEKLNWEPTTTIEALIDDMLRN